MRSSRLVVLTSFGCALALLALPAGAATKKASTAECAGLIDVFRQKGCAASLYNDQIDPPLRQRIEAVVPQPKAKAPAKKTS